MSFIAIDELWQPEALAKKAAKRNPLRPVMRVI